MTNVTWELEADLDADGVPETSLLTYIQMPSKGINISREQALGGAMKSSALKVQLSNRSGEFTPRNTNATIGRKLRTGVACRVTAIHNSKSYTLWTGYVLSRSREQQSSSRPQMVTLEARSRLAFLGDAEPVYVSLSSLRDVDNAISAIASEAGLVPADDLDLWDSDQDLEWHFSSGQNPLDAILDAALSEMGGQLYELADGKIAFESRSSRLGLSQHQRLVRKLQPLGYWRLGEFNGTVAYDHSGNGNNGAYHSGTLAQATLLTVPDGVSFDMESGAAADYISVPDDATLDFADVFSLSAVVRPESIGAAMAIFDRGGGSCYININASGYLVLEKNGVGAICTSTVALVAGTTYHIAVTKTGATVKLYIDGVDVSGVVSNQTLTNTAAEMLIGVLSGGSNWFDGRVQEIALFGTALSATDVYALYESARGSRFAWGDDTSIQPREWSEDINDKDVLTQMEVRGTNYLEGQNTVVMFEFAGNIFDSYLESHVLELSAGQVWTRRFQGKSVWVTLETPVAATDYLANDAADGSGTNRTSSLGVSVDDLGGGWLSIELTNNHSGTIHVTYFQIRGIPLDHYADRAIVSISLPIDQRYATTRGAATDIPFVGSYSSLLLKYAVSELRIARYPIERLELEFMPDTDTEREAMLALEIGELIYYTDTAVGLAKGAYVDDWYYVTGIEHFLPVGLAQKVWSTRVQLAASYNWRLTSQLEHDDFGRANAVGSLGVAPTGGAWQDDTGFDIDTLVCVPNTDTEQVAWIDLGALAFNQAVEAKFSDIIGNVAWFGVAYRCQDADNCYVAFLDVAANELVFGKLVAGTYSEILAVAWTQTASAEIRAICEGSRHRIWLDGEIWIDTTDATQNTGTGFGLYTKTANGQVAIRNCYGGRL